MISRNKNIYDEDYDDDDDDDDDGNHN